MNKKFLKALALVGCALLLVTASVVGTYAVLTSQTATITNTFTAGQVAITLDEATVDVYGVVDTGAGRKVADPEQTVGNSYKLIPTHTYVKDPTVHVVEGSEPCWLFVKVVNGISDIEIAEDATNEAGETETIAEQMAANGWVALTGYENVYYYETVVDARNAQVDKVVFGNFTLANVDVAASATDTITIAAYAVQADGLDTPALAWTAASFS